MALENSASAALSDERVAGQGAGIEAQIRQFIFKSFPLARKRNISDTSALLESGVLDSLGVLDVVAFLEQTYAITMADEELVPTNFQSIEQIAYFVRCKISIQRTG